MSLAYRYKHSITNNLNVFADAGVFFWDSDVDTKGANGDAKSKDGTDPMLALGIDYSILKRTSVGLKYRYHRLDDENLNGFGMLVRVNL